MVWFPLHAPEKVDTAEIILFLLHSRLLTHLNPPVNHPYMGGGGIHSKNHKIFRHGGFQVDTDG
jgi:hypothetical protein